MPFITQTEFEELTGPIGRAAASDPAAFERARAAADERITSITGVTAPSDPSSAPIWAKHAAAWLILYDLMLHVQPASAETMEFVSAHYREALAELERRARQLDATVTNERNTFAKVAKIDGLYEW